MLDSVAFDDPFDDVDRPVDWHLPAGGPLDSGSQPSAGGPSGDTLAGPFVERVVQLYPPVSAVELTVLAPRGDRHRPFCDCPRAVRCDGSLIVWHQPHCDEMRGDDLAAIL